MRGAVVSVATIETMAAWYATAPTVPPAFRGLPERMIAVIDAACDGDWRRCVIEGGVVTIYNHPLWEPA